MMRYAASILSMCLLAACGSNESAPEAEDSSPTTIHGFMVDRIDPDADAVWNIGNAAINEQAGLDPELMSEEDWEKLAAAATRMQADSLALSRLDPLHVRAEGQKIADEGTPGAPTPEEIDAHLARDPELFRSLATTLANHMGELNASAMARDSARTGQLINELDGVCESCHLEFWYPAQKELIKEMNIPIE